VPVVAPRLHGLVFTYTVVSVMLTLALFGWIGTGLVASVLPAIGMLARSLATGSQAPAAFAADALRLFLHLTFVALTALSGLRFARLLGRWIAAPEPAAPRAEKEAS
jgi:hypothetical protein